MSPSISVDPLILENALSAPGSAVGYRMGRVLEQHAGGRAVMEVADSEFDEDALVDEGRCTAELMSGLHHQRGATWKLKGRLEIRRGSSWTQVQWEGRGVDVVRLIWREEFRTTTRHWVIAEDHATAERFATAVLDAVHLPARRVLVYSGSCWRRDSALFEAVQLADWDALVLPGDLADRIRDDVASFVSARDLYVQHGVPYKRGVLLTGPPGNGKTHCVRALMKEARLPTLYVRSFEARYGEIDANIQSVFQRARRVAPCLLVLEDLDAIVKPANLSIFLNELDGISGDTGILTLATSNHAERLDPALLERPSRFDRKYHFDLPGPEERQRYLQQWMQRLAGGMSASDDVVVRLVAVSDGFSYAYLKELVVSSMLRWVKERRPGTMEALLESEVDHLRQHMDRRAAQEGKPKEPVS